MNSSAMPEPWSATRRKGSGTAPTVTTMGRPSRRLQSVQAEVQGDLAHLLAVDHDLHILAPEIDTLLTQQPGRFASQGQEPHRRTFQGSPVSADLSIAR